MLTAVIMLVLGLQAGAADLTKTLTDDLTGITTVVIDARVADVRLESAAEPVLRTQVVLDSRDDSRLDNCAKSELRSRRDGSTLRLSLSQPGRKYCGETWSIQLPRGIAVDVSVEVGSIDAALTGGYGDVDVRASVGKARLELNGHRLSTTRRSGPSETIRVDGDGPGVKLRANVGNVAAVVTTRE